MKIYNPTDKNLVHPQNGIELLAKKVTDVPLGDAQYILNTWKFLEISKATTKKVKEVTKKAVKKTVKKVKAKKKKSK